MAIHYPRRKIFLTDTRYPSKSVQDFKELSENIRYEYCLIIGHNTHHLLDYVHPDTITLTIFRDPVERIVSHYFYVKQDKENYLHDRVVRSNIALKDYASLDLSKELRNWYTTHFTGLSIEQAEKNPDESVNLAVKIILERYNLIGFQNDLRSVMNRLRESAHLFKPFDNKIYNKTRKRAQLEDISEEARRNIAEVNFLDIRLYNKLQESLSR